MGCQGSTVQKESKALDKKSASATSTKRLSVGACKFHKCKDELHRRKQDLETADMAAVRKTASAPTDDMRRAPPSGLGQDRHPHLLQRTPSINVTKVAPATAEKLLGCAYERGLNVLTDAWCVHDCVQHKWKHYEGLEGSAALVGRTSSERGGHRDVILRSLQPGKVRLPFREDRLAPSGDRAWSDQKTLD